MPGQVCQGAKMEEEEREEARREGKSETDRDQDWSG